MKKVLNEKFRVFHMTKSVLIGSWNERNSNNCGGKKKKHPVKLFRLIFILHKSLFNELYCVHCISDDGIYPLKQNAITSVSSLKCFDSIEFQFI